jgi:hypothetical protein
MKRTIAGVVVASAMAVFAPAIGDRHGGAETHAIVALKSIAVAENAYASMYGRYEVLDCLTRRSCSAGQDSRTQPLLNLDVADLHERHGYRINFHLSASDGFAATATPVLEGAQRHRAFCTDRSGQIYIVDNGSAPRVENGRCLDRARPLQ